MRLTHIEGARVALLDAFDPGEAEALRRVLLSLAGDEVSEVQLDELLAWERIGQASLSASVSRRDVGVEAVAGSALRCALTREGWTSVAGLLELFTEQQEVEFFQYLSEEGTIRWIVSTSGEW